MRFYYDSPVTRPENYVGIIPFMLDGHGSLRDQLHRGYTHGGGWQPFDGFTLGDDNSLLYPGDPPQHPRVWTWIGKELLVFYDHAWVAIIQEDRSFEVARMDRWTGAAFGGTIPFSATLE